MVKGEDLKKKAMNRIFCTMESRIVKELGRFLQSLDIPGLKVMYPVYDGVVLEHAPGSFTWKDRSHEWDQWCVRVFGVVPVGIRRSAFNWHARLRAGSHGR